jgi:hypothetical protein
MANKKTGNKRNTKAKPVARVPRPISTGLALGDATRKYAALLADPCNGDLVTGPFGDGSGGMVARFEREYFVVGGAGSTACAFAFCPALCNFTFASGAAISDTSTITWSPNTDPAAPPGYSFLVANATSFRPLACCMQVYWTGTELNRQGVVSLGRMPTEVFDDTTLNVARIRTSSQYSERTPDTCSEVIWRPQEQDLYFKHTGLSSGPALFSNGAQNTSLVMTGAYLPADTPLRVRIVVVYEWVPDPLSGFKTTTGRVTSKPSRLADVLAILDRTGDWMAGTATSAARAMSSLGAGVGSIMSLGRGAARLGTALLAAA